ncbi:hypothetical protein CVS40_1266 [Lucilia cuprina]|nr:hypothetical protein CVS40_1266 [Lucilia cuprina]
MDLHGAFMQLSKWVVGYDFVTWCNSQSESVSSTKVWSLVAQRMLKCIDWLSTTWNTMSAANAVEKNNKVSLILYC